MQALLKRRGNRGLAALCHILILMLLYVPFRAQAQTTQTLHFANTPLKTAFVQIEKAYGVKFVYNTQMAGLQQKVTLPRKARTLAQMLEELGLATSLRFRQVGRNIGVQATGPHAAAPTVANTQPVLLVRGHIKDAKGQPLPGATLFNSRSSKGAATDAAGAYAIEAQEGDRLLVSYIGYQQQAAIVNGATLNITLEAAAGGLQEVVVTGYTVEKKLNTTVASNTLGRETIGRLNATSPLQLLQGQVPGIMATQSSGLAGAMTSVRIRGIGTITSSSNPLYVVDGIIMSDGQAGGIAGPTNMENEILNNLNTGDIESITVLKDAPAMALYGSRGSNGVVVITTRKGQEGRSHISFTTNHGLMQPLRGRLKLMNSAQLLQYHREVLALGGMNETDIRKNRPDMLANYNTDWFDLAYRNGATHRYNLSVSGGSSKTKFYVSGEYASQQGITKNNSFERYSGLLNLDHRFNHRVNMGIKVNLSSTNLRAPSLSDQVYASPTRGALQYMPFIPAQDADGNYYDGFRPGQPGTNTASLFTAIPAAYRPLLPLGGSFLYAIGRNYARTGNTLGLLNASLGVNITSDLQYTGTLSYNFSNSSNKEWVDPNTYDGAMLEGQLYVSSSVNNTLTAKNLLQYNRSFNNAHRLAVVAGQEYQHSEFNVNSMSASGFSSPQIQLIQAGAVQGIPAQAIEEEAFLSYLANAAYDYRERYFLSASLRTDASSKFAANRKWGTFYSVSAGWRLDRELFMQHARGVNLLKLRASYGVSGNSSGIGRYSSISGYKPGEMRYNGTTVYSFSGFPNPYLSWEKSGMLNAGVDAGLFGNRLWATLDVYNKLTYDMLFDVPVSSTTSQTNMMTNGGRLRNRGWEITLGGIPVQTKNFSWRADFNIGGFKNTVVSLLNADTIPNLRQVLITGQATGTWYMKEWTGVNPDNGAPTWRGRDGKPTSVFADAPLRNVGNALPRYSGGFTNTFRYRNLELQALLTFTAGQKVLNMTRVAYEHDGVLMNSNNLSVAALDYWKKPGDKTGMPKPSWLGRNNSNALSSRYLEDASFLRLSNLRLAYTIEGGQAGWRRHIDKVSLFAQAQNLFTITGYKGMDPDVSTAFRPTLNNRLAGGDQRDAGGTENFRLPGVRTFNIGCTVNL